MKKFFCWTLLYTVLYSIGDHCFKSVLANFLIIAIYTILLTSFYIRANQSSIRAICARSTIRAIPLFVFAMGNLIFIRGFSFCTVALIALCSIPEEILFRGLLQDALSKFKPHISAISCAVIFSLYHLACGGGYLQALCALCFGYALSSYMLKYKSIILCITAHALTNLLSQGETSISVLIICCLISVLYGYLLLKNTKEN